MKLRISSIFLFLFLIVGLAACENERLDPILEEALDNPTDGETDSDDDSEEEGDGSGDADGNGDGDGSGDADGNGDGNGDGSGDGDGNGDGSGDGDGNGDGMGGDGNGDGSGDGMGGDGNGDGTGGDEPMTSDYFPLVTDNRWNYAVAIEDRVNNENFSRDDSFYISGTTMVNGLPYFTVTAEQPAAAIMTNIFDNSSIRSAEEKLNITGSISFPAEGLEDFVVDLTDVILYDKNISAGSELTSFSDTYEQSLDGGITLEFQYTVRSIQGELIANAMVAGVSYDDVITSSLIIDLRIIASGNIGGVPVTVDLLRPKDVLVIENTYADQIGLISSTSTLNYQLEDFSSFGVDLPYNTMVDVVSFQELTSSVLMGN
ncbi:hypothetical protein [Spongiivirga citrea]|uniref:Uncharacterized protein n=1 Tax=Spongiivirga citrea TaxID=1481457 RepID=A0A6M0CKZ2_9FLAO|nr:hypothetical protein [Spongiivirga citrea]NER16519.1 hypothetical protein [Spongiivirga citrea]